MSLAAVPQVLGCGSTPTSRMSGDKCSARRLPSGCTHNNYTSKVLPMLSMLLVLPMLPLDNANVANAARYIMC